MKKFLSVILALAFIIVPIGSLSSFAFGTPFDDFDGLKDLAPKLVSMGVKKAQTISIIDKEGRQKTNFILFGELGEVLSVEPWPEVLNPALEAAFAKFQIVQTIIDLKCDEAILIFDGDDNGNNCLYVFFYDSKGELLKYDEYRDND